MAPKVSKGRSESPLGSEAFVASGDKEKAERVSRNERPLAATIEAADAARRRETSAFGKAIVTSENSMIFFLNEHRKRAAGGFFLQPLLIENDFRKENRAAYLNQNTNAVV